MKNTLRRIQGLGILIMLCALALFPGRTLQAKDIIEGTGLEPAYETQKCADLTIRSSQSKVTLDTGTVADALLIQAKNSVMKSARFTIADAYQFGTDQVERIEIDALALRRTTTNISFYLDDSTTPFTTITLPEQTKSDVWTRQAPVVIDLSDLNTAITGTHQISFSLDDQTTADDKKTSVLLRTIHFVQASIPVVYINIDESLGSIEAMNGSEDHSTECYGSMTIKVPDCWENAYDDDAEEAYTGGSYAMDYIRGRGNSTWDANKKPYKIKLTNAANLFNMGSNKHWVLLAESLDPTLLHNHMTYALADELGLAYSVQDVKTDVYMNGVYLGNYTLAEQVRIDSTRVDIDDLSKNYDESQLTDLDLTGGYIIGMSNNSTSTSYTFKVKNGEEFIVNSPESDDSITYTKANEYIHKYMQRVDYAINGQPNEEGVVEDVWDLMDLESAVRYYWIQECAQNSDGYATSSTYLYKPRDVVNEDGSITESKLYWGPIWDFDLAWKINGETQYFSSNASYWMPALKSTNATFIQALKDYWPTIRDELEEIASDGGQLDQYAQQILPSAIHNYVKYPGDLIDDSEDEGSVYFPSGDSISTASLDEAENVLADLDIEDATGDDAYALMADDADSNADTTAGDATDSAADSGDHVYTIKAYYENLISQQKKTIRDRISWIDGHLDELKIPQLTVHYVSEGKTVYTGHEAFIDRSISLKDLPSTNPKSSKSGVVFDGWTYQAYDVDSESYEETLLDEESVITSNEAKADGDNYVLTVTARYTPLSQIVYPKQIYFEKNEYYVKYISPDSNAAESNMLTINYSIYPEDATNKALTWTSSDPAIAAIDTSSGNLDVELLSTGDVTISCTTENAKKYSIKLHILSEDEALDDEYLLENMSLSASSLTLAPGGYKKLYVITEPEKTVLTADQKSNGYYWQSDNDEVATVDNAGLVIAQDVGTANITIMDKESNIVRICKVTVKETGKKTKTAKVGDSFTSGKLKYKVTKVGKTRTVKVTGEKKNYVSITVPSTVKYLNQTYKVTRIQPKAFCKKSKLKTLVLGKNLTNIGSKAFYQCKNLKKISIHSTKLKYSTVGKKAFAKISKKARFTLPKSKKKAYKKLLKKMRG